MNRIVVAIAFATGLLSVAWVGSGFIGSNPVALLMTLAIAGVYLLGAEELRRFRAATASLRAALDGLQQPPAGLGAWLENVPAVLRTPVRLRIEGERAMLPAPALTPYLVGLLVMLGMLGTFLGMVVTFKGAVFALEGSTDLQAIRGALAAPIKGLGLSFGTSVAGVAASAMLGLLSALSRRERADAARLLDTRIATVLRPFSLSHQREETLKALQVQAHALPEVVQRLAALAEGLERRGQQLDAQLLERQEQFHGAVRVAYTDLAQSVGSSLQDSLAAGARAAGESLQPVVATAMAEIAQDAQRTHQRVADATQAQLDGVAARFEATAGKVSAGWSAAVAQQAQAGDALVGGLGRALAEFTQTFEQRSGALVAAVEAAATQARAQQGDAEQQRLQAWTQALAGTAETLSTQWQQVGEQTLQRQQAVCDALQEAAGQIAERTGEQAGRTLQEVTQVLERAETLVRSRIDSEAQWTQQQGERMEQLAGLWRSELAALRAEEAARGEAAVQRLGELQAALATHLATLGTALEAPLNRLLQTASEVPQAAAEVIVRLREETARLSEQDQRTLVERAELLERTGVLLQSMAQASGEQRAAIESLVTSAAAVLEQTRSDFAQALQAQTGRAADTATQVEASAIELASLGAAFGEGTRLFSASHEKLIDSLQRVEEALQHSMARSDEQLAYYVAQAREVIDLSIASQQGIVEELRRREPQRAEARTAAAPEGRAAAPAEGRPAAPSEDQRAAAKVGEERAA